MRNFKDSKGRVWEIAITVGTMKRVRALCGIDLYKVIEIDQENNPVSKLLEQLAADPILLVDVLYAVCKPDADKLGVSDMDFGESMCGDAVDSATNALLDDLVDFFPEAKRMVFRKVLLATRRFQAATEKQLNALMSDPELDRRLDSELQKLLNSPTNTQESSESTQTA